MPTEPSGAVSLSVVVAAWNGPNLLRACLESLALASGFGAFEVVVATADLPVVRALLETEFPWARVVVLPGTPNVPELRLAGLQHASGEFIAFLEDHAAVAPSWAEAVTAAHRMAGVLGVGGPVAPGANLSTLEWGAYLVDYGRFMPPCPSGARSDLSGVNMSFARSLLDTLRDVLNDGVFEGPLFEELRRRGVRLFFAAGAIVYQSRRLTLREALRSSYYLARGYADRRLGRERRVARIMRASSCVVLPLVMVGRVMSEVLPKRQDTTRVVRATGFVMLIAAAWSLGEFVGYLAGAGDSDSRWR